MFIDGLDSAIKILVACYRKQQPKIPYLELVQFVQAEGDAFRAQTQILQKKPVPLPRF